MTTKTKNMVYAALIISIVAFALVSCDDFFDTSWGKARKYDSSKINLTLEDLPEWKEKAAGNPDLAESLVEKILGELDSKSGAEKAALQDAGIDLAIEQSGIGTTIIELAGGALSSVKDESGIKTMLDSAQSKFNGNNGKAAAENIAAIVAKSDLSAGTTPKFSKDDPYAAQANPSDVGMAVAILALAVAPNLKDTTDLKTALSDGDAKFGFHDNQVTVSDGASKEEIALAAYLNLIADDRTGKYESNPIAGGLKKAFKL